MEGSSLARGICRFLDTKCGEEGVTGRGFS